MKYLLFCSCFLIPKLCDSTCVLVWRVGNAIYVAADSRGLLISASRFRSDTVDRSVCKIRKVNQYYFAIAGKDDDQIAKILYKQLKREKNIDTLIWEISEDVRNFFVPNMHDLQSHAPAVFDLYRRNYLSLSDIVIFYFQNDTPCIKILQAYFRETNSQLEIATRFTAQSVDTAMVGIYDHIGMLTKEQKQSLSKKYGRHQELLMDSLVRIEASHHRDVGDTVQLLKLTRSGEHWFRKKKSCN